MFNRDSRRSALVLALVAALTFAAFPAHALPRGGASHLGGDRGAFTSIFETLRSVWVSVWGEEGMTIDPDGRPAASRITNVLENNGMTIDPDGRPNGNATNPGDVTNEGITIDPNG